MGRLDKYESLLRKLTATAQQTVNKKSDTQSSDSCNKVEKNEDITLSGKTLWYWSNSY